MVKAELEKNGVHIHLGERVMSFEGEDDKVTAVKTDKDCYAADVVILSDRRVAEHPLPARRH